MISKLRKMYYSYKDEKELKKFMPKEETKSDNNVGDSKTIILMIAGIVVAFAILIVTALIIKGIMNKKDNVQETTVYVSETTSKIMETTTLPETTSEEVTTENATTVNETTTRNEFPTFPPETTRKEKVTKQSINSYGNTYETGKKTSKPIKKLGTYSEKNVISKSKVNVIRNSITSGFAGSVSKEKQSLAAYMSKNGLKNAESTYKKLTNSEKSFRCKTCSIKIDTDSEEEIINAAEKATSKIGSISSDYGIGICTTRKNVGYGIFIVVIY